jgi:hypothetical protein
MIAYKKATHFFVDPIFGAEDKCRASSCAVADLRLASTAGPAIRAGG